MPQKPPQVCAFLENRLAYTMTEEDMIRTRVRRRPRGGLQDVPSAWHESMPAATLRPQPILNPIAAAFQRVVTSSASRRKHCRSVAESLWRIPRSPGLLQPAGRSGQIQKT